MYATAVNVIQIVTRARTLFSLYKECEMWYGTSQSFKKKCFTSAFKKATHHNLLMSMNVKFYACPWAFPNHYTPTGWSIEKKQLYICL